jgi:hypothetical protein
VDDLIPQPHGGKLRRLKKGETGNPNGRPKKLDTILHDYFFAEHNVKLSKAQTQDMIQVVLGKTRAELVELAKNDELPFWISLIAKKATRDFEKGSIHILDVLFDRVYGKPREEITQNIIERPIFTGIDLDVQEDDSTGEDSGTP